MNEPEGCVVFQERIPSAFQEELFCNRGRPETVIFIVSRVRFFLQHLCGQTPVTDALNHVLADSQLDNGVIG